jgi:hypothetical protein
LTPHAGSIELIRTTADRTPNMHPAAPPLGLALYIEFLNMMGFIFLKNGSGVIERLILWP